MALPWDILTAGILTLMMIQLCYARIYGSLQIRIFFGTGTKKFTMVTFVEKSQHAFLTFQKLPIHCRIVKSNLHKFKHVCTSDSLSSGWFHRLRQWKPIDWLKIHLKFSRSGGKVWTQFCQGCTIMITNDHIYFYASFLHLDTHRTLLDWWHQKMMIIIIIVIHNQMLVHATVSRKKTPFFSNTLFFSH